ncbi:MAG: nucleotidyltransferase substrate binding protein [Fibrobacteria bacterium]|nr:nucleotidyltransferase substrate binding protein [Fibrobacteria bacterium]
MNTDIRWIQRFKNYLKAFEALEESVELSHQKTLSKLEKQGLIQGFEYTHELAWNVLKDYLTEQGIMGLIGSKDCTRSAFKNQLLDNGEIWMEMIKARNLTSHTYDETLAESVFTSIVKQFYPEFASFTKKFTAIIQKEEQ